MPLFLNYIFNRFIYRVLDFFRHWYINSFYIYTYRVISFLRKIDKRLAIVITWRYLFQPLYQDRTFIGYFLGFLFRIGRLVFAALVYFLIIAVAILFYLVWLAIPVFLAFKIISGIFMI